MIGAAQPTAGLSGATIALTAKLALAVLLVAWLLVSYAIGAEGLAVTALALVGGFTYAKASSVIVDSIGWHLWNSRGHRAAIQELEAKGLL